jgi:FdhE protein
MTRWQRRIERAAELETRYPATAALLRFYGELAQFQSDPRIGPNLQEHLPALLDLVRRKGTSGLAAPAADDILSRPDDPVNAFFVRAIKQPYFERQALENWVDTKTVQATCPFCFEKPVVAILRPEGDGGRRTLQCGLCFTEWEFRRLLCPCCGEEDREKLPVYTAPEFSHIRVEACDTCRHYIKSVDTTRDGRAVPEVDEIAALPLDCWAVDHDYEKLAPSLFW